MNFKTIQEFWWKIFKKYFQQIFFYNQKVSAVYFIKQLKTSKNKKRG